MSLIKSLSKYISSSVPRSEPSCLMIIEGHLIIITDDQMCHVFGYDRKTNVAGLMKRIIKDHTFSWYLCFAKIGENIDGCTLILKIEFV